MKSVVSKKAFTIVELLVAMGLVVILVALSSLIFAAGVKAHRLADSTIEITRRAEAVSRQLVADVGGLRTDAPLAIWFEHDPATGKRYDQILFFANGDFQTMRQYNGQTVSGNLSRIYYGHAWQVNTDINAVPTAFTAQYRQSGLLSRRAHLLTSNLTLTYPGIPTPFPNGTTPDFFAATYVPYNNNRSEYDQLSLAEWKNLMQTQDNCNQMLQICFNNGTNVSDTGRPMIDMTNIDTLHLLLSEQISEFKVQWAFTAADLINPSTNQPYVPGDVDFFSDILWWPQSEDISAQGRGVFFNMPGIAASPWPTGWRPIEECRYLYMRLFSPTYVPRALKFTFTVHDAKGLFPEGKTFTQIVKIDN